MAEVPTLNRLEHYLLTSQMDDTEPSFVLYRMAMRNVEGATLDLISQALIKLVSMGLSKCYTSNSHLRPCKGSPSQCSTNALPVNPKNSGESIRCTSESTTLTQRRRAGWKKPRTYTTRTILNSSGA